jgi:hypothetical protein
MKRLPNSYFKLLPVFNFLHKIERAFTHGPLVSHDLQIVFIIYVVRVHMISFSRPKDRKMGPYVPYPKFG